MKIILIFLVALTPFYSLKAQYGIGDNGKYIYFVNKDSTTVQSTNGKWKLVLPQANSQSFVNSGKQFIYVSEGKLHLLDLETKKNKVFIDMESCIQINYPYFACRSKSTPTDLRVINLSSGKQVLLKNITNYKLSSSGLKLLITQKEGVAIRLLWMPVGTESPQEVWVGAAKALQDVKISPEGNGVAFLTNNLDSSAAITYWSAITGKAKILVRDGDVSLANDLKIYTTKQGFRLSSKTDQQLIGFNRTGDKLLFYQEEQIAPISKTDRDETQIWSYLDPKVYPYQEWDAKFKRTYATAIDVRSGAIVRLEQENSILQGHRFPGMAFSEFEKMDKHVIIYQFNADIFTTEGMRDGGRGKALLSEAYSYSEFNWNKSTQFAVWLVSLHDGNRKELVKEQQIFERRGPQKYILSPYEKFLGYYDFNNDNYILLEISTGEKRNVTEGINAKWMNTSSRLLGKQAPFVVGWLPQERGIVIADSQRDEWLIDFAKKRQPICFRNKYRVYKWLMDSPLSGPFVDLKRKCFNLIRVNDFTNNGIFSYNEGRYEILVPPGSVYDYSEIMKAERAEKYVVTRSSMNEPKEILLTNDFKNFKVLVPKDTSLYKSAIKKEIITWKTFKGKKAQGFLYKPLNFDSSKKYPVVINYYEESVGNRQFQQMNEFYSSYLERGYLVFYPEIRFSLGEMGTSAYDFVVSGAEMIAKMPFVNEKKMGIFGGSFGGYHTNFLITHTNLFAAAVSEAGPSNLISDYGSINEFHRLPSAGHETGQFSSGVTPWDRSDLYIKNSPIFYVDRVSTPLLLRHSIDENVSVQQSIEFFIALRRLGKKVWFLTDRQIQHGGPIYMNKTKTDLVAQFFDHYLKNAPAPRWMLEGVPARLRGIESRTELDTTGKTPGKGLVMENRKSLSEEHEKILSKRTRVTNEGRIEDVKVDVIENQTIIKNKK